MRLDRPTRPRLWSRLRRAAEVSDGFSMVELMVAIVVFAILSAAVLTTLNLAIGLTRSDRNRVAASNLAARELEIVRRNFNSVAGPLSISTISETNQTPLPGAPVGPTALVVDNVPYTLTRTATWTAAESGPTSCDDDGSSTAAPLSLRVHVEVTWPKRGSVTPVVADTLLTPKKGTYNTTTGHIGVKVLDRNGTGANGRTVTVNGPGGTHSDDTNTDGCVLFPFLAVGTYTVSLSNAGYVDRQGATTPTTTAVVVGGQLWTGSFDYDQAATINATFTPSDPAYPLPNVMDLSLNWGNSGLLPDGSKRQTGTGATRSISNVWPAPGGYQLWGGDCVDSDPSRWATRANAVGVSPGGTATATVDLGQLAIGVTKWGGPVQPNQEVWALHYPDTSCQQPPSPDFWGDIVKLGSTNASGGLARSLPYGTWTIYAVGRSPTFGAWPTVVISRGAAPVGVWVYVT